MEEEGLFGLSKATNRANLPGLQRCTVTLRGPVFFEAS